MRATGRLEAGTEVWYDTPGGPRLGFVREARGRRDRRGRFAGTEYLVERRDPSMETDWLEERVWDDQIVEVVS